MESKKRADPIGDTHDSFPNNDNNQLSDETDAKSWTKRFRKSLPSAVMPVERDSEVYYMTHPKRGKAVIFNHKKFENRLSERNGTEVDEQKLKTCLSQLGFEVFVYRNLKLMEIRDNLNKLTKEDHSDSDCLLIVVLSHGVENKIYSSDSEYEPKMLWEDFTPDNCPTLAGKPKMFFINACRGDHYDDGTLLKGLASRRQVDGPSNSKPSYRIPNQADFLTVFSTSEGFCSWRNSSRGTCFIQALCEILNEHSHKRDLLSMLTLVNRQVALNYESHSTNKNHNMKKQIPHVCHTLTRDVYFQRT